MKILFSGKRIRQIVRKSTEALLAGSIKVYRRAMVLIMIGQGSDFEEISKAHGVSIDTIQRYLSDFVENGIVSFKRPKPTGRPPKLTKEERKQLKDLIKRGPLKNGFPGGAWRTPMIQELILKHFGQHYSVGYLPRLMKSIGFSWQKSKSVDYRQDIDLMVEWKTVTWPKILKKARRQKAKIYFEDECSFAMDTGNTYTWAERGKQPVCQTTGTKPSVKVFGAIEYYSGKLLCQTSQGKLNSESYINFLRFCLKHTRGKLFWIHDGVAYHRSKELKSFLADNKRIWLYRIPPYSPELNPIEKLWKQFKSTGTHMVFFKTLDELLEKIEEMIAFFSTKRAKVKSLMANYA